VLRAVVLTQYRRVTDGRTDGIAVANRQQTTPWTSTLDPPLTKHTAYMVTQ